MRTYFGMVVGEGTARMIFATVTGQMADGTLIYTEIDQNENGSIKTKNGEPVLILDNQFSRHLKHGTQTFTRI